VAASRAEFVSFDDIVELVAGDSAPLSGSGRLS